jgi:hypothetical protein
MREWLVTAMNPRAFVAAAGELLKGVSGRRLKR